MQKHFSGKNSFIFWKILFFRPRIIEKGHKTPISQFCFNPLNFVSFLNFVSLFSSRENETKMSGDSISVKLPAQFFIFEFGSWILFCFSQPHFGAAELDLSQSATRPRNICLWGSKSRHVLRRKFSRKSSSKLKINYEYVCNITKNNNPNPIGKNPVASVQYLNFK